MSFEATRAAIVGRFKTGYADLPGSVPTVYDNQPGRDGALWGRFAVLFGTRDAIDINCGNARGMGFAVLQVFMPENTGTKAATDAADALAALFDFQQIRTGNLHITFRPLTLLAAGARKGVVQHNVEIPFTWETY